MNRSYLFLLLFIVFALSSCNEKVESFPEKEGRVIILMYHRIVDGEPGNIYERSLKDFESDLIYLIDNNIHVIDFTDLTNISESGRMPEGNSAILTFDDGDNSWYNLVAPMLLRYRMKATFFLWTHMIGNNSFLTWNEVEYMSNYTLTDGNKPFSFGSHSFSHPFLSQSRDNFETSEEYNLFLDYELRESKKKIEEHTPGEVTVLALPYGDGAGDPDIIAAAQRNGYQLVRTSVRGVIENADFDSYIIPSLPILDDTSPEQIGSYLFN